MSLDLGKGLSLPLDAVTRAGIITGQRGTGKTSTAAVLVEEATAAGAPSIVIDPTDAWWGLRSSADGKWAGLGHIVFGGEHGHLPLREDAGAVMARLVVEQRLSAVFSLKHLRKGPQIRFVCELLEELYHVNREALLVVIDEGHRFAPQSLMTSERGGYTARCLGAVIDIGTLGRVNGLGIEIVTQRLARLHKDVVEACEIVIVHRLLGPNDRKAIEAWLRDAGEEDEAAQLGQTLPKLKRGEALVYAPDLDIFGQFTIRPKRTFDSSGTPEVGAAKVEPRSAADVDLSAIEAQIGETIEQARQDDPKHLRARIKELERELASRPAEEVVREIEVEKLVEAVPTWLDDRLEAAVADINSIRKDLHETARDLHKSARSASATAVPPGEATAPRAGSPRPRAHGNSLPHRQGAASAPAPAAQTNGDGFVRVPVHDSSLGKAERMVLTVLAQHGTLAKKALAMLAGYSAKGGGFNNALGRLRSLEYINRGEPVELTPEGAGAIAGQVEPLPTGRALLEHWMGQLGRAERLVLEILTDHWPDAMPKEQLAELAGYTPTGGGFNNALGKLRTLQLINRGPTVALDETLGSEVTAA